MKTGYVLTALASPVSAGEPSYASPEEGDTQSQVQKGSLPQELEISLLVETGIDC